MIEASTMSFGKRIQTNVQFKNGPRTLSMTLDNGPGFALDSSKQARVDIRLFVENNDGGVCGTEDDVTSVVFGGGKADVVRGTVENMDKAMRWLRMTTWGFRDER